MPNTPVDEEREEELDILFGTINRFIGLLSREAQLNTQHTRGNEYPFVAMDTRQAYEQLRAARRYLEEHSLFRPGLRFIDVGCGIGNILLMAELMGFQVFGIEKDPVPQQIACRLFDEATIAQADIWEFTGYSDFDVLYYFRPFPGLELQTRFERMVEERLKPGGILIANRKMDTAIETDARYRRIHPPLPIWQRIG